MLENDVILFYDGDCAFCNNVVKFLLRRDKDKRLRYAPLKGETFAMMQVPLI